MSAGCSRRRIPNFRWSDRCCCRLRALCRSALLRVQAQACSCQHMWSPFPRYVLPHGGAPPRDNSRMIRASRRMKMLANWSISHVANTPRGSSRQCFFSVGVQIIYRVGKFHMLANYELTLHAVHTWETSPTVTSLLIANRKFLAGRTRSCIIMGEKGDWWFLDHAALQARYRHELASCAMRTSRNCYMWWSLHLR